MHDMKDKVFPIRSVQDFDKINHVPQILFACLDKS